MKEKKAGRPKGTSKYEENATEKLTLRLTPTGKRWVESKPKGFVSEWIEEQARK